VRRQRYVVAQARKLASAGDPTLRGFVHWIETLRKNELYDAESAVPDSDENAVRLMTVHGSKGLEFPIVFLSGLGGGVRANDGVQLLANHAEGRLEARCTVRPGLGPAFATHSFDGDREKQLEQAQQLRLLYVAATRAREHLVLSLFHSPRYARTSHAASICNRLSNMAPSGVRPTEITVAELERYAPRASEGTAGVPDGTIARESNGAAEPGAGASTWRPGFGAVVPTQVERADSREASELAAGLRDAASAEPREAVSPEAHKAAEAVWQTRRQHLVDTLGRERLVTPSGLAHAPEPEPLDLAISADSNADDPSPRAWRSRKEPGAAAKPPPTWASPSTRFSNGSIWSPCPSWKSCPPGPPPKTAWQQPR